MLNFNRVQRLNSLVKRRIDVEIYDEFIRVICSKCQTSISPAEEIDSKNHGAFNIGGLLDAHGWAYVRDRMICPDCD